MKVVMQKHQGTLTIPMPYTTGEIFSGKLVDIPDDVIERYIHASKEFVAVQEILKAYYNEG